MIKFVKIDHVQICIPLGTENMAREFYGDLLGLTEIPKPNNLKARGGLWYKIADIELHIGVEDGINSSKRHPAFEIVELEIVKNYLLNKGVKIK